MNRKVVALCVIGFRAWGQSSISVAPPIVAPGDPITITIAGAPPFPDNWYSPYPGTGPTLGGWDHALWGWLDGTQSNNPPAVPIINTTIKATAPTVPGDYVYVLQSGDGTTGPYKPIPPYAPLTVTTVTPPPTPLTFTAGTGATAATCTLTPPAGGFISLSCTACQGATKTERYPSPIPAPGTMAQWLLCGNTVSFTFTPSTTAGKTDYAAAINGNGPAQTGTF